MERVAVFVDAGYFWVQVSHILYGEKRSREEVGLKEGLMLEYLRKEVARQFPGTPLLRVYWYDGLGKGNIPTPQHKRLAGLDDIKMRYGTINSFGHQKGVDGLLMADLLSLAQNKAINSALLISGDADLAPGVNAAQTLGVRIHRLEISGPEASSPVLCEEVDKNIIWTVEEIKNFIFQQLPQGGTLKSDDAADSSTAQIISLSAGQSTLEEIANEFVKGLNVQQKEEICVNSSIPYELDRKLLYQARSSLGRLLGSEEKKSLRATVQQIVQDTN